MVTSSYSSGPIGRIDAADARGSDCRDDHVDLLAAEVAAVLAFSVLLVVLVLVELVLGIVSARS